MLEYYMVDLALNVNHEAFPFITHGYIMNCKPWASEIKYDSQLGITDQCIELEILRLLVESRGLEEPDNKGNSTPLHIACRIESFGIVQMLVKLGADVNSINDENEMPLGIVGKGDYSMAKLCIFGYLKDRGAKEDWK